MRIEQQATSLLHCSFVSTVNNEGYKGACNPKESLTYYLHDKSTIGFFAQNPCWTLLQVYGASENISHSHNKIIGNAINEFMMNKRFNCINDECNMEKAIKNFTSNCTVHEENNGGYYCTCITGTYGATCSISVEEVQEDSIYKTILYTKDVKYVGDREAE